MGRVDLIVIYIYVNITTLCPRPWASMQASRGSCEAMTFRSLLQCIGSMISINEWGDGRTALGI